MDTYNFDDVTRVLATNTSRRKAFKLLFSTAVAGVFGAVGLGTVQAAACKPNGATCKTDSDCCSKICFGTSPGPKPTCLNCKPSKFSCTKNSECCNGTCSKGHCK